MTISNHIACCGLREINGLSHQSEYDRISGRSVGMTPEEQMFLFCLKSTVPRQRFSHAVFSQAGRSATYGEKFAAFIIENKLGDVAESVARVNPNSGNRLKVWVWTLNKAGLSRWYAKTQKQRQQAKEEKK